MYDLEYPHITAATAMGQTEQITSFLWKTIERLNYILGLLSEDIENKNATIANYSQTVTKIVEKAVAIPTGHVDATSTSTKFTATVDGITELKDGVCVFLTNGVVTSAANCTLNINGLGAKRIYNTMAAATAVSTTFNVAYTMLFVYNSTRVADGCWDMYYGYNSDTNTIAYNVRTATSPGIMNKACYRYQFLFCLPNGKIEPTNTTSNKPSLLTKALTTETWCPFEPIYYYASTGTINAGSAASASYCYMQHSTCDLRYAFNAGTTLTIDKPVYIRCVPQGDCQVKLDGDNCITQTLPSTADGKVYLYLGRAYSSYQIWLSQRHPIYEYVGGKLQIWNG